MAIDQITKGAQKRVEKENKNVQLSQQKQNNDNTKKFNTASEKEYMSFYKKTVVDSYIAQYAKNYDDGFDYNSLVKAFSFNIKNDKNGLTPSFNFKVNDVMFKSDAEKEHQRFNENSKDNFVSNDRVILGDYNEFVFDDSEDYDLLENGDVSYSDISDLDGMFISTSKEERYNTFNRINKLDGYRPAEESAKDAQKLANSTWDKIKGKVLSDIIKKFKL